MGIRLSDVALWQSIRMVIPSWSFKFMNKIIVRTLMHLLGDFKEVKLTSPTQKTKNEIGENM